MANRSRELGNVSDQLNRMALNSALVISHLMHEYETATHLSL